MPWGAIVAATIGAAAANQQSAASVSEARRQFDAARSHYVERPTPVVVEPARETPRPVEPEAVKAKPNNTRKPEFTCPVNDAQVVAESGDWKLTRWIAIAAGLAVVARVTAALFGVVI